MMLNRLRSAKAVMIYLDRISWAKDATPCFVGRRKNKNKKHIF